jgi:uncharacterized membrane protein YraQ (UPF0718 family)
VSEIMFLAFVAGFLCRALRIALEASPYILIGLACSGWARASLGPARLRAYFGDGRWSGPLRAWAAATILPVCALGVIPILRELRRSGVRRDAVLTFALAAPAFNPITILSAWAHLGFGPTALLLAASGAAALAAGAAAGRSDGESLEAIDETVPPPGRIRGAAAAVHALREAAGPMWKDLAAGVIVACAVSALVSPSWLAEGTFAGDPCAVARMAAVAAPAYVSPEVGVTALPEMVKFRQSAGAMLVMVVLGVGFGAGHLAWASRSYGIAATSRWCLGLAIATFVSASALNLARPPVGAANPDNDHYDALVSPVAPGQAASAIRALRETLGRGGVAGVLPPLAIALSVALSLGLRAGLLGPRSTFEDWIPAGGPDAAPASRGTGFDRPLPGWVVRAVGATGGASLLILGASVAFPSPAEAFRDMSVIKADYFGEIGAADVSAPLHHLDLWERSASRLPIGAAIRLRFPDAEARRLSAALAEGVRGLRAATEMKDLPRARMLFHDLQPIYESCRRAYHAD